MLRIVVQGGQHGILGVLIPDGLHVYIPDQLIQRQAEVVAQQYQALEIRVGLPGIT